MTVSPYDKIQKILSNIAHLIWKQDGCTGEAPIPTLEQLQAFTRTISNPFVPGDARIYARREYRDEVVKVEDDCYCVFSLESVVQHGIAEIEAFKAFIENLKSEDHDLDSHKADDLLHLFRESRSETETKETHDDKGLEAKDLPVIADFLLCTTGEPSQERLQWLHEETKLLAKTHKEIKHPLSKLIRAWLHEQIPTVQLERRKTTGILPHKIRDSFPPAVHTQAELLDVGGLPQGGRDIQGILPGFEFPESEIVPALPLVAYEQAGGNPGGRGRGAPIEQRLFVNLLIGYPKQVQLSVARMRITYRDILQWLYPTGIRESKKTLVPKLREGLRKLHNLWFRWERRDWNIISVESLPTMDTKPDDILAFTVRFPEGMNTGGGARIVLPPLRFYGARSAPCFRAWPRLAYLWDAAKLKNGLKRIYATIPEVLRDTDGYLTDANGQKILTGQLHWTPAGGKFHQGKMPQTAWYHPLAVKTGRQIRNPQADKVPVLDDRDLVKLFFDHNERKGQAFRRALHAARKYAEQLAADGYIVLEKDAIDPQTRRKGWRILEPRTGNEEVRENS